MTKRENIATLTDYISYMEKNCNKENILFRGQQQDWPLLPKLARIKPKIRLRPTEYNMIKELQRTGHPYVGHFQFQNEEGAICIDPLVFAQHNGMATRLLDWTLNPLAALWFAIRKAPAKDNEDKLLDGVVWIFCPDNNCTYKVSYASPFPNNGVYIHRPNHVTPQIVAQQGLFTIHGYDEDGKGFIPMEEHEPYKNALTKLVIPGSSFSELRFQLDRCGINEASMFPGIAGLCRHIEWYHTLLDDEDDDNLTNQSKPTPPGQ